jgi:hypothetical protein
MPWMNLRIIKATEWEAVRAALPPIEQLLNPIVPAYGKTLLHGPPGSGKSAVMWGIGNAVVTGASYLGLESKRANVLLISTDMSLYELKHRWNTAFVPLFDLVCLPGFDCTKAVFKTSLVYNLVRHYVADNQIQLVMVDALGGIHSGRSARDDEVADEVDHRLSEWLPDVSYLLLGHDRKLRYNRDGEPMEPGPEDFLGSQKWRANATTQLHMWPVGEYISVLQHAKSQVAARLQDKIKLYIDLHGRAELWNEHRAGEVRAKYRRAIAELGTNVTVGAIAAHYGVSERTVQRWKSMTHDKE